MKQNRFYFFTLGLLLLIGVAYFYTNRSVEPTLGDNPAQVSYSGKLEVAARSVPIESNTRGGQVSAKSKTHTVHGDDKILEQFVGLVGLADLRRIGKKEVEGWLLKNGFEFKETSSGETDTGVRVFLDSIEANHGVINFRAQLVGENSEALYLEGIWMATHADNRALERMKASIQKLLLPGTWKILPFKSQRGPFVWRARTGVDVTLSYHDKGHPTHWSSAYDTVQLAIQPSHGESFPSEQ